jgi:1,4-dihydroxy-2-naphthoyl-CoA synthase
MASLKSLASYRTAIDSEDAQEGTAAFNERRTPTWKGC